MGDAYDDYCDMMDAREHSVEMHIQAMADAGVWVTQDGRQLKIADMDTNHLQNTIRMLERSPRGFFRHIDLMKDELKKRGER